MRVVHPFNSDVADRICVAVDLVNASVDGALPGVRGRRPDAVFTDHGYRSTTRDAEWRELATLAVALSALLRRIAAGEHRAAVTELNRWLREQGVVPYVEARGDGWALHFHTTDASFAQGWAGGIAAALALGYGTGSAPRVGRCTADGCQRLFADRGRNQQRRFCSLQCQNRVKSSAYRRRTAVVPAG